MSPKQDSKPRESQCYRYRPQTPGRGEQTSESQTGPRQSRTQRQPRRGAPRRGAPGAKGETQNKGPEPGENQGNTRNQQTLRTPIGVTGELKFEISLLLRMGRGHKRSPSPGGRKSKHIPVYEKQSNEEKTKKYGIHTQVVSHARLTIGLLTPLA